MVEWYIIYHDGINLSHTNFKQSTWNDAPTNNVQILIIKNPQYFKTTQCIDEYHLYEWPGSETKFGKLITSEQWRDVRNFLVTGAWKQ
jgi:hypothetical protein